MWYGPPDIPPGVKGWDWPRVSLAASFLQRRLILASLIGALSFGLINLPLFVPYIYMEPRLGWSIVPADTLTPKWTRPSILHDMHQISINTCYVSSWSDVACMYCHTEAKRSFPWWLIYASHILVYTLPTTPRRDHENSLGPKWVKWCLNK